MASHELDKVDTVRARIDATYTEVKEALDAADGDVLGALVHIEKSREQQADRLAAAATKLLDEISEVARGEVSGLTIRLDNLVVAQFPVALTGLAAALAGCVAVLLTKCTVEVEMANGAQREPGEAGNRSLSSSVSADPANQ